MDDASLLRMLEHVDPAVQPLILHLHERLKMVEAQIHHNATRFFDLYVPADFFDALGVVRMCDILEVDNEELMVHPVLPDSEFFPGRQTAIFRIATTMAEIHRFHSILGPMRPGQVNMTSKELPRRSKEVLEYVNWINQEEYDPSQPPGHRPPGQGGTPPGQGGTPPGQGGTLLGTPATAC